VLNNPIPRVQIIKLMRRKFATGMVFLFLEKCREVALRWRIRLELIYFVERGST
jgi:hypothetical protein